MPWPPIWRSRRGHPTGRGLEASAAVARNDSRRLPELHKLLRRRESETNPGARIFYRSKQGGGAAAVEPPNCATITAITEATGWQTAFGARLPGRGGAQ